jgi:drug/metabolite transporter (DMT)-like permease
MFAHFEWPAMSPRSTDRKTLHFSTRASGSLLAALAVFLFSIRPVLVKICYGMGVDPLTLLTLRMGLSAPAFALVALALRLRGGLAPVSRRDGWLLVLLGFIGYYASSLLDFTGLQYIPAGLGRLILFAYPTLVVMLSWLLLGHRADGRQIGALALTYAGLGLVLGGSLAASAQADHVALGSGLVFVGAITYALYLVLGAQVVQRVGSMRFTAYATLVASLFCVAQFGLTHSLEALQLPPAVWGYAVTMALGCTVIPLFLTAEALKRVGASDFAIIGALGPVTTLAFGFIGLDEALGPIQVAGALVVLAGVLLVSGRTRRT